MLEKIIGVIQEQGFAAMPIKLSGTAKAVFAFIDLMANTEPEETMPEWWGIKLDMRRN